MGADASGFIDPATELGRMMDNIFKPIRDAEGHLWCDECDREGAECVLCDHKFEFMHKNLDAPLPIVRRFSVPMFKTVALPQDHKVEPWEIEVLIPNQDANSIGPVHYAFPGDGESLGDVLCLVGPYDGRYAIRTAILTDLHAVEKEGQLPCGDDYHDGRFDHEYAGKGKERARLVDSYFRKYLGVCYPCHQRSQNQGNAVPGNLGALGVLPLPRGQKKTTRRTPAGAGKNPFLISQFSILP